MTLEQRLSAIQKRIEQAAISSGRLVEEIRLVSVSKTMPVETVREAIEAGAGILGENYIQEARTKIDALIDCEAEWHFIGHLQSNKARYAVRLFDLIHSVDSLRLARELDQQAAKAGKVQSILIQVNVAGEKSKFGTLPDNLHDLVAGVAQLPNISLKGLMTMPPFFNAPEKVRPYFSKLRHLRDGIAREHIKGVTMEELSMGMTGDFEVAISEGATLVRVGTAIFGERQ